MKGKRTTLVAPAEAAAILCFLEGQYLLKFQDDQGHQVSKFLTSASVASAFTGQPIDSGWLPDGVNRWGKGSKGTWMLRWHQPAKYTFHVEQADERIRKLRISMPALVWFGQKTSYYIWAMKGSKFDPKGSLHHAPLPNIDSHGVICFGQNTRPSVESGGGFEKAWRLFWEAPFNGHHVQNKSGAHREDVRTQLNALARSKAASYPNDDLVKGAWTLEAAVKALTERGDSGHFEDMEVDDDFDDE
jgi:PRTRC genetic system protein B